MLSNRTMSKFKRLMLAVTIVACGTASSCAYGLQDLRHNVTAGTASFLTAYTAEFWTAVAPTWDEILNADE